MDNLQLKRGEIDLVNDRIILIGFHLRIIKNKIARSNIASDTSRSLADFSSAPFCCAH